ncbi:nucleotidyltransferase family protein [Vibrio sonorensis]|uniref:nucleotidyltransferase family protein n=1 Tax=Vibrio sonorensis TaxID=1004316 RepID=UPI0008D91960|nr:nucleotidyltransferase family protein [Vibrio sonorensis]
MVALQEHEKQLIEWLAEDKYRSELLKVVSELQLPDCYIAAGFVRNLVWDRLHKKVCSTPLNDVDVVYYDANEANPVAYQIYQDRLKAKRPDVAWQVRNQAKMHIRNGDMPYRSSVDAMSYWPEKETAVAARINAKGEVECVAAFGLETLFNGQITPNPKRSVQTFYRRVREKGWLVDWPQLKLQPLTG